MEQEASPKDIGTLEYRNRSEEPWVRIMRTIAVVGCAVGGGWMGQGLLCFLNIGMFPGQDFARLPAAEFVLYVASGIGQLIIGGVAMSASIGVIRGRSWGTPLMVLGAQFGVMFFISIRAVWVWIWLRQPAQSLAPTLLGYHGLYILTDAIADLTFPVLVIMLTRAAPADAPDAR